MGNVVLISCGKKKAPCGMQAQYIYEGSLFKKSLEYAKSINPDDIFILSAKHNLLGLEDIISPYDETLNGMKSEEIRQWSNNVLNLLERKTDLTNDEFTFLAGENYRKYLIPHMRNYSIPMQGLGIGQQLQWLTRNTSNR